MTDYSPKADILSRYHALVQEWNRNAAAISQLQDKQTQLAQQSQDFGAAARIFGFDLTQEYQDYAAHLFSIQATPYVVPPPTATRGRTVRDLIIEMVTHAYPAPVLASALRTGLEAKGVVVHEKTVGMTLYRLSKDKLVRRQGRAEWFFVPEDQRSKEDENPGDEPGFPGAAEEGGSMLTTIK